MTDAFKKLIEAVEAGEDWISVQADAALRPNQAVAACNAYGNGGNPFEHGSLDAAKALHDILLPGWHWSIYDDNGIGLSEVQIEHPDWQGEPISARSKSPARAWLLAILRARLAEAE